MQHVVFWSSLSGPTFQRVPALADALELVQRLRNDHDVTDAEVHALTAVPLNFRTVVVVEAAGASASPLPDPAPAPAGFESFSVASNPVDEYGAELAPLGATVPGVVPDPVGPFRSLASVGTAEAEPADEEPPTPHLVGLPSVAPDVVEDVEPEQARAFRTLEVVAEALHASIAEDAAAEEPAPVASTESGAARSLGLFA